MADEIDLTFLGEQIRRLQADVRDLKARSARTDADVLALNEQMGEVNERLATIGRDMKIGFGAVDQGFESVERRLGRLENEFAAMRSEMTEMRAENTRNLEIVLTAIRDLRE